MLNVFILILLETFDEYYFKPNNPLKNFKENLENFSKVWVKLSKSHGGIRIGRK